MVRSVAFFRNLNLGQGTSPTRSQLLDAFADAGINTASSFQVNGTVVFEATDPQALADDVARRLAPVCGYADAVLVRPLAWLAGLHLDPLPAGTELSLFDGPESFPEVLPWRAPRGDVTILRADGLHAVSANDDPRRSNGTPVLERRLGVPVTSRGVPTIQRLLARFG